MKFMLTLYQWKKSLDARMGRISPRGSLVTQQFLNSNMTLPAIIGPEVENRGDPCVKREVG